MVVNAITGSERALAPPSADGPDTRRQGCP
jgi:hypothetical protein